MYPKNHVPKFGVKTSVTGCCPLLNPTEWEGKTFTFENKPFIRAKTRNIFYVPLNMAGVMQKTRQAIRDAGAEDANDEFVMLSQDVSPWKSYHHFWVAKPVEGLDNETITGTFKTKVFEGPYSDAKKWYQVLRIMALGASVPNAEIYLYYTTCPKCAKVYDKNYVVGFVKIA